MANASLMLENLRKEKRLDELMRQAKGSSQPAADEPFDFSAMEMISNIPESGANFAADMAQPILHPIDTAKAVGSLGRGAYQKLTPGVQEDEATFDAAWDGMKERYGGWDEIKRTAQNDPVGLLSDAAGLLLGGGSLTGVKTIQRVGAAIDPVNLVKNTAAAGVKAATPKSLPGKLYQRSAKFSTAKLSPEQRSGMIDTALNNEIMPTGAGVQKLEGILSGYGRSLDALISGADKAGQKISKYRLLAGAKKAKNAISDITDPDAAKLRLQYEAVIESFESQWDDLNELTPSQAQTLKRNLDEVIRWDRKTLTAQQGTEDARKAVRTSAKESIEKVEPGVAPINRKMGELIELRDKGLAQSAARIENRDTISLSQGVGAGVGGGLGGLDGAVFGATIGALNGPIPGAKAAILIRRLHNSPLKDVFFENGQIGPILRQFLTLSGRAGQSQDQEPSSRQDR